MMALFEVVAIIYGGSLLIALCGGLACALSPRCRRLLVDHKKA